MKIHWLIVSSCLGLVSQAATQYAFADYSFNLFLNPQNELERQLMLDGFHFGTVIEDAQGRMILRPHPDRSDINGWGTSWFMNPSLAGGDHRFGVFDSIVASSSGIDIQMHGSVANEGAATYGSWQLDANITYDPDLQLVQGAGTLDVTLDGTLAAAGRDLNLEKISSNFLHNVPRKFGDVGDTGDTSGVINVIYGPTGTPQDFTLYPPAIPAHFPSDSTHHLLIQVTGDLNNVDTVALGGPPIATARKPTFQLLYTIPDQPMTAGLFWDASHAQDFTSDNIGINHLVLRTQTTATIFNFNFEFQSTVVPTQLGDTDYDGDVDFDDFLAVNNFFGDPGPYSPGDADGDGDSDFDDFLAVNNFFGTTPPGTASGSTLPGIPEPASLSLLALAACGFAFRRRSPTPH